MQEIPAHISLSNTQIYFFLFFHVMHTYSHFKYTAHPHSQHTFNTQLYNTHISTAYTHTTSSTHFFISKLIYYSLNRTKTDLIFKSSY
jgi:hypothetical protein